MRVRRDFDQIYANETDPWAIGAADSERYDYYFDKIVACSTLTGSALEIGCGYGAFLARLRGPVFVSAGMAGAALRKWVLTLHGALAGQGVYAGHVAIGTWIAGTPGAPEGVPLKEPDDIARLYWDLHTSRETAEHLISAPRIPRAHRGG